MTETTGTQSIEKIVEGFVKKYGGQPSSDVLPNRWTYRNGKYRVMFDIRNTVPETQILRGSSIVYTTHCSNNEDDRKEAQDVLAELEAACVAYRGKKTS